MKKLANRAEVQRWLDQLPFLTEITEGKDREEFEKLLGHPGFGVLLGLLLSQRQGMYAQLSLLPLSNAERAARASVIQGQIQGIELVWQTVLEQCNASPEPKPEGAK